MIALDNFELDVFSAPGGSLEYSVLRACRGLVGIGWQNSAADRVSTLDVEGVSVPRLTFASKATGEAMGTYLWFLGQNIPAGAELTATWAISAGAAFLGLAGLYGDTDIRITGSGVILSDSVADPSVIVPTHREPSLALLQLLSGHDGGVGSITPLTDWSALVELNISSIQQWALYMYDLIQSGDVTAGWTQTAEDALALGINYAEFTTLRDLRVAPGDHHYLSF